MKTKTQFTGRHWETGSIHNVLALQGVKAPHTGEPYSEALLLGISGGIAFGYFTFEYKGYLPHVAMLTRNTFSPFTTMLERLGIAQDVQQTNKAETAERNLIQALESACLVRRHRRVSALEVRDREVVEELRASRTQPRRLCVRVNRFTGLFRQFELHWMSGLALADASSIGCQAARGDVLDLDANDITPAQLAVDCKIEHRQVAFLAVQLELSTDRPHVLGLQGRPGADHFASIPRNLSGCGMSVVR